MSGFVPEEREWERLPFESSQEYLIRLKKLEHREDLRGLRDRIALEGIEPPQVSRYTLEPDPAPDVFEPSPAENPEEQMFDEPEGECRKSAESATKPRLELVPFEAVEEIADVLTFGAQKYGANNWRRGARWGRYFAALLRHLFAWWRGEDLDKETGLSHLAHAGCCLFFLMTFTRNGWGSDDRPVGPEPGEFQKHDGAPNA